MTDQECETCGRVAALLVYALPGIPMSIGNCRECYQRNAYPLSVAVANTECIGGLGRAAAWWREAITFKDGRYMTVVEALGSEEEAI